MIESKENIFKTTWFSINLNKFSGVKLWKDPNQIEILGRAPYDLTIPVNWLDNPYNHRSWCWIFNSFQWMDQLLSRYKIENDESAINNCVDYFLDWISFYIDGGRTGEFLWKDDAVSFRTFRISLLSKYILDNNYSVDIKKKVKKVLSLHYLELIDRKKFKSNNHGIFQMRALISLLTLHPDLGCIESAKKYSIERLNWLWSRQYGTQNIHLENSSGYHQYIIKEFDEIIKSPEFFDVEFIFSQKNINEVINNTRFFFHPNGIGTLFGDSNFTQQKHEIVTGDYIFNEAGYAFLAGNSPSVENSYLAVRTGFPSNAHRHSDDFSFEWSEKGQIIFQDSGRHSYDYNSPFRKFITSSRAHNTVTVNGENFPWWGDFDKSDFYSGAVEFFSSSEKAVDLGLCKNFLSKGINFQRSFHLERGKSLVLIDIITSNKNLKCEQWFHLAEDFEYKGKRDNKLYFVSDKLSLLIEAPENSEVLIFKGNEKNFIQGWVSYKEKHLLPRWSLGFVKEGQSVLFETRVLVLEKGL